MSANGFRLTSEIPWIPIPFGKLRKLVEPASGAKQLVILEGVIRPGEGHDFHQHPHQEEVIFVRSGRIEQWIGQEMRMLEAGDAAFLPPGMVHASFNGGGTEASLVAIFGPAIGEGFETVEMAQESPWKELRRR